MPKNIQFDFQRKKKISDRLYGLFLEDINFALDGGLNNNQIQNHNFDYTKYLPLKDRAFYLSRLNKGYRKKKSYREVRCPLEFWSCSGDGKLNYGSLNDGKPYLKAFADGTLRIKNLGYNGGKAKGEKDKRYVRDHRGEGAIGVKKGVSYTVEFYLMNKDFSGDIVIFAASDRNLTEPITLGLKGEPVRRKLSFETVGIEEGVGCFYVKLLGKGEVDFDFFYFGEREYYGYGDPKWTGGRFRRDLVEALKALKPSFMRFPGGCLVEGYNLKNRYRWKETVGKPEARRGKPNLWEDRQEDGDLFQSYQIGFYELFLLCEELNAKPLPILNAGLACQGRSLQCVKAGTEEFQSYIDDALDLIEYANGDPKKSHWAKLRAESGHPEPFNLSIIGIGNENWGDDYFANFLAIKEAVTSRYPYIETVYSVGFEGYGSGKYEERRLKFDESRDESFVDDHFYRKPKWAFENTTLYDTYDRKRAKVFLGEFAVCQPCDGKAEPNNYLSALSEGAFYTGIERNADAIELFSYAPLFSRVDGAQWQHNLINFNSLYPLLTANYLVFRLFSQNYGSTYLESTTDFDGLYISATMDESYVYVKIVNENTNSEALSISFDGANAFKTAELTTISCEDDYARNELSYNGKPNYKILPLAGKPTVNGNTVTCHLPLRSVNLIKIKL